MLRVVPGARLRPLLGVTATVFVLVSAVGCGSGKPCSVAGQVLFDGQPIPDGNLRMDPIDGTPGPGGAAKIVNGKYFIPMEKGMLAGTYRVRVTATKRTGRMIPVETLGDGPREREEIIQYIPDRYNRDSEVTVQLAPGENTKDFNWTP